MLNEVNCDNRSGRIKYHVLDAAKKLKRRIQTDREKIVVLVNDGLSGEPTITDFTLSQVRMHTQRSLIAKNHGHEPIVQAQGAALLTHVMSAGTSSGGVCPVPTCATRTVLGLSYDPRR